MGRTGLIARGVTSLGLLLAGCASNNPQPPVNLEEPIGLQLMKVEPVLREQRFSTLLSFEDPSDFLFIAQSPTRPVLSPRQTHTGRGSLQLSPGTQRVAVKLPSLLMGREFPDGWMLAGAWFRPRAETRLTIAYEHHGQVLVRNDWQLPRDAWTAAMVDVSSVAQVPPNLAATSDVGTLIFEFNPPTAAEVVVDDVILIDNSKTFVDTTGDDDDNNASSGEITSPGWSIERRGYRLVGESPQGFSFSLKTPEASAEGWALEETNELRARFSSSGKQKALTVYVDGRAYWDGQFQPMARDPRFHEQYVEQHVSPAKLVVPEEFGKVIRNSPGDANNDGYNETTGDYRLSATGPRFEVRIVPRSPGLLRPVFQVHGLPEGKVLATLEGRLIERMVRLPDGTLLIEIPANVERPTTLNLRVQ